CQQDYSYSPYIF
nr:immunoglobulin light chain junction region [Macaca mulatta]MOX88396.1 immunoglobulin light chain junction region [Macaca mulatta]MOX88960.1 immunoglobulin light chain junction region [Macaca mulatta]